ncbi:hypothetical protein [Paenibacillus sp. DMB5]|uniref:hypothetical protein n=1 Tax=Paenibacillus sp. DMB5 TaxID=1780103 RepID=UPI00076CAF25|nr:hypothetical protein [Paenibacillus sp. DMB5]KUP24901.1 hypothetical protein AWJ19_03165 [Paenibacillus sp. DMB5]
MFFFFSTDGPGPSVIEELVGEEVLLQRQYHSYQTHTGQISHYYVLTASCLADLCIAEDSQYSRVFARYDRSILERDNYFPAAETLMKRIFDKAI